MSDQTSARRVERCVAVFDAPPKAVPDRSYYDGPLLGNGDLGVVIGGTPDSQQFWFSKCDFWRAMPRYPLFTPVNIGWLDVGIPALAGASFHAEQILATAEVRQTFKTPETALTVTSWTPASENALILEFACAGKPVEVDLMLQTRPASHATSEAGRENGSLWLTRQFSGEELDWPNTAAIAVRVLGTDAQPAPESEQGRVDMRFAERIGPPNTTGPVERFTLQEGCPVRVVAQVGTSHEFADPLHESLLRANKTSLERIDALRLDHCAWWRGFWEESEIDIGDDLLERFYYGSFYIMACSSRNTAFAPAISGVWTPSDYPTWGADYHMNYNHQAPWWGCYGANHISITEPYDTPVLQYLERGKHMASSYLGKKGILYCVGIGPLGSCSCWEKDHRKWEDDSYDKHFFAGQKSNAAWGGVNMVMRWRATLDPDYANRVYPYLLELANFWEDYLVFDGTRYIVVADAIHESNISDVNSVIALGLIRSNLKGTLDMSVDLSMDADRRGKWQDILDKLSDYPVYERDGVKVFRYTEVGQDWQDGDCVVGLQHVYPADTMDLDTDPALLEIAKNTVTGHPWGWDDNNHTMTMMPCAARIGYDPETILTNMREKSLSAAHAQPNLYLKYGGGGIEACSTVTATLQEMLLQSALGTLRVFANWPKARDARFTHLRAYGAFLVSSKLAGGVVEFVTVLSERGRPLTLVNPWPGRAVRVTRPTGEENVVSGERFTVETVAGEEITLTAGD